MKDHDLDRLLRSYSGREPRVGIESRVLNRVTSQPCSWGLWWVLVPVLGCVAAAVAVLNYQAAGVPLQPAMKAVAYVPLTPLVEPAAQIIRERHAVRHQRALGPRITPEERALVQFATADPDRLGESLDDLDKRGSESIQISEIKIEPLEIQ